MVGIPVSCWEGLFSGAMLVLGSVPGNSLWLRTRSLTLSLKNDGTGRRSGFLLGRGMAYFQGRTVKLQVGKRPFGKVFCDTPTGGSHWTTWYEHNHTSKISHIINTKPYPKKLWFWKCISFFKIWLCWVSMFPLSGELGLRDIRTGSDRINGLFRVCHNELDDEILMQIYSSSWIFHPVSMGFVSRSMTWNFALRNWRHLESPRDLKPGNL